MRSNSLYKKVKKHFRTSPAVNPLTAILSTVPAMFFVVAFVLVPSFVNLGVSFTDYAGFGMPWEFVGLENYINSLRLNGSRAFNAFKTTLVFSFFTVIIQQLVSFFVAILVNQKVKGTNGFRALFFMPTILGVTVVSFVWSMIFDPLGGPLAKFFYENFGKEYSFLGDPNMALPLTIFVVIWANFGFSTVIYVAGLQNVPRELKEAAWIDGASSWTVLRKVTLPMLRPTFSINFWISISGTLTMYDLIFVLTAGSAGTQTFALYFFMNVTSQSSNKGEFAALSMYWFAFVTAIMLTFNYFFRRKEVEL